jgi:transketolase
MRAEFAQAMIALADESANSIFLTGDLGYMALEGVRDRFGTRFINAGVAEQNMTSLAAGLAHEGFIPWLYSIAPFAVLRPYEQIRNDICLHNLPVKIVGNGGGYGYGIMGSTHHTLEDIGVMRCLPNMKVYVPLTGSDVGDAVRAMAEDPAPNYLRLNLAPKNTEPVPRFSQWRRVKQGNGILVIGTGPVLWNVLAIGDASVRDRIEIWSVGILPFTDFPDELVDAVARLKRVVTIEEHYGQCGLNEAVAALLLRKGLGNIRYRSAYAKGYPSGRYGSQTWHQEENGLAGSGLESLLRATLSA